MNWYPLLFKPVYRDYLWGGDRIARQFHRDVPPGIIAESWEITDRDRDMSVVENGPLAGTELGALTSEHPQALLGEGTASGPFPLLIKMIDAQKDLSVQVHPNDATAALYGGEAKTEMWIMLHTSDDAAVYAGLMPGADEQYFTEAMETKTFRKVLRHNPVKADDVVFVPGGRVHAVAAGCLLLEVQQNSDTTYRIYDWDRVGADGKPRELHTDRAMEVIDWDDHADPMIEPRLIEETAEFKQYELLSTPYFRVERWTLSAPRTIPADPDTFRALFAAEGAFRADEVDVPFGRTVLLPAALGEVRVTPSDRTAVLYSITKR